LVRFDKPDEGNLSMAKKLYVGNLSYNTSEDSLRNLFAEFGNVASAKIIFDRETGNSKGFGFVEMGTDDEASAAITGTNGREFEGRQIRVNEAMDKPRRDRGGAGGGYGGGNW
jgi:RNA recognition motif-containing protein